MSELPRFDGFGANAIAWFEDLARDNSKTFFDRTRSTFETQVRAPLAALLDEAAGEFGGHVKVFRQNRDIRFSADKSPYKLNTYGIIFDRPKTPTGLYASISAKGLYAATGYYQMTSDQLDRYRAAVADDRRGPGLERAIAAAGAAGLELWGDRLKTVPRGYPRDHPRAGLLAHKDIILGRLLPAGPVLQERRAYEFATTAWRDAEPLVVWLDKHVGPPAAGPAQRPGSR